MTVAVTTNPATEIHSTTAYLNGSYTKDDETISDTGFEYYKEGEAIEEMWTGLTYETFSFFYSILIPDTVYYFRARVNVYQVGIVYGGWQSFRTNFAVIVTTNPATEIHSTTAYLNGSYTRDDEIIPDVGFEWYKEGGEIQNMWLGWNVNPFSVQLTQLIPDTVYYFRARVNVYQVGIVYGSWSSFITGPHSTAITKEATQIKNLEVTLNGRTTIGEDGCIESAFEWKKGEAGGIQIEIVLDYGGIDYNTIINNLICNTIYYFRARGKNDSGIYFYGDWLSFITSAVVPTVSTQIATDIDLFSVTGNGTLIDIGGGESHCGKRGFEVKYSFSGTLEEYNAWKSHGFTGDVTFNSVTGLWEGTLTKSYEEFGTFSMGAFTLSLNDLICDKEYLYRARARNTAGWGYGSYLAFTTNDLLIRKSCTCGIFTIMLCAYVKPIPSGSVIKRRGFRWGKLISAEEYDIHEDGDFPASAIIGPIDTISFVNSADDSVYDTIVDSAGGFLVAGFVAGKFIDVSATGAIDPANEGQFKIISVTADTIIVNVRNTLVSEAVTGVTIVDLFALYIVDLDPETIYYSVAYVAVEDSLGVWTVQEGNVTGTTTIANIFDFEGYDRVEFYNPEREQNYKKITRKIEAEITAEQQYIDLAGGRRFLPIKNHLIQTKENAITVGTNYKDRFKNIKSLMSIEYPTPAPLQREDTLDIGFGRIKFKEDDKGVVNFMPDGEGLMLFRYRMTMLIRKINMDYAISKENIDYMATLELEEA